MTVKLFQRSDDATRLIPSTLQDIFGQKSEPITEGQNAEDRGDGRTLQQRQDDLDKGRKFQDEMVRTVYQDLSKIPGIFAMSVVSAKVQAIPDIEIAKSGEPRTYFECQGSDFWFDYRRDRYGAKAQSVMDALLRELDDPNYKIAEKAQQALDLVRLIRESADPVGVHVKFDKNFKSLKDKEHLYLLQGVGKVPGCETFVVPFSDVIAECRQRTPLPWGKNELAFFIPKKWLIKYPSYRSFMDKTYSSRVYNR